MVTLSDGKTVSLYNDLWLGSVPKLQFPELYSFANDKISTLLHALDTQDMFSLSTCLFQLKLMASLQSQMACVIPGSKDLVLYLGTGSFSSQKAYTHMKGHREVHAPFKWIWKSSYLKHKIFL